MSKHIVEETPAKGSHAQGDNPVEKQASQLAYDVKYKVKQQLNKGTKLNPAQVAKAYMAQLAKSPAPPAVKALAKKKLIGEEYTSDVASLAEKAMVNAMVKVFVEGVTVEKVEVEVQEEVKEKQYKIRVTDKKTGNTYVRMASRAKIAELRANPNISSVEMTGYGQISGDEKSKGKQTAAAKAGKDYDGDGKVESGAKEYRGAVHNAIQRKKGLKPDGKDTSSVKEEIQIDEGLRSAVKRLLGKKDAPAEKKPESRGEQLRKKYNVGPEKSDTSAKRQILDRTRARKERDEKEYGGSHYSKSVAKKSADAHDRYLRAGYSKYGADRKTGSGNKARRRAEALKKEDFNWLVDTLISEGYNLSAYTVDQFYDFCEEVIYEKEGDIPEKKITGKGVNNQKRIKVYPNSMSEQAPMTAAAPVDKPDPAQKRREQQNDRARQQEVQILQKKLQALRSSPKGSDPSIMASYEAEGEVVEQKVCDKCGKSPCECDKEDARELPTKMDLFKNKLRARGIKVAGITPAPRNMKIGGEDIGEEASDRARDEHQMRGGMAARVDYDRPPAKKLSNAELGIKPGKTWVQKQMEKKKQEKK